MGGTMNRDTPYKIKYLKILGTFLIIDAIILAAKEKNKNE